jgi:periplasmic divalent cation tolerance protein
METKSESGVVVVLTTVATEEAAERLAQELVERRLAACVNVLPQVRSIYRWQGAVQDDRELLLLVKTTRERRDETMRAIAELHPYDVPEVVALDADAVSGPYASWLGDAVRRG